MHLDFGKTRVGSKVYTRVLLRESFRDQGKVKHRTIANLSACSPQEIAAIKLALKHKHDLAKLTPDSSQATDDILWRQGLSIGAVAVLKGLAEELGIVHALGCDRQGKLALWQVIARVIDQGSRLSAVRLAATHACCDLLDLDAFNEDTLYQNLAWLCAHQPQIEDRLFSRLHPEQKPALFLYDVTSSYLEGTHNVFGNFGYNRDGKRGKHQIVVGLLCDAAGAPLSIEVFAGNTSDTKTFGSQVHKVAARFGGGEVSLVGDRGMIKGPQIEQLQAEHFHYITAISKPQIEKLLKDGVLEMDLFDEALAEVTEEKIRYILRRNPRRAQEIEASRASKVQRVQSQVDESNGYLAEHPRATLQCALKKVRKQIASLKLGSWVSAVQDQPGRRCLRLEMDDEARTEEAKLDGCYALTTDLPPGHASKEVVHARYKDLTLVEQAFRTSKTVELELRPIHVRCEASTRGHALVVMLAYRLAQELSRRWSSLDLTIGEGVRELDTLCAMEMWVNGAACCQRIPEPRADVAELIRLSRVKLPQTLRSRGVKVATKKKLDNNRIKR
jgi:Transposase DDE domain